MESQNGKLLLAEIEAHPRLSPTYPPPFNWSLYASGLQHFSPESPVFHSSIYFDDFTFTELLQEAGSYTVCQKNLCCYLNYSMAEKQEDEFYALGVFDGLHVIEGEYYLQVKDSMRHDGLWDFCVWKGEEQGSISQLEQVIVLTKACCQQLDFQLNCPSCRHLLPQRKAAGYLESQQKPKGI